MKAIASQSVGIVLLVLFSTCYSAPVLSKTAGKFLKLSQKYKLTNNWSLGQYWQYWVHIVANRIMYWTGIVFPYGLSDKYFCAKAMCFPKGNQKEAFEAVRYTPTGFIFSKYKVFITFVFQMKLLLLKWPEITAAV